MSHVYLFSRAPSDERSTYLIKENGKTEYHSFKKICVEGKEGQYDENYYIISKYDCTRPNTGASEAKNNEKYILANLTDLGSPAYGAIENLRK